jgi:mannan endo-1,4-beta-mannosidase
MTELLEINVTLPKQGLDYVVATAAQHDMRLVLTLTNYLPSYGGAQQYVQWIGGSNITAFYARQDIRWAPSWRLIVSRP